MRRVLRVAADLTLYVLLKRTLLAGAYTDRRNRKAHR